MEGNEERYLILEESAVPSMRYIYILQPLLDVRLLLFHLLYENVFCVQYDFIRKYTLFLIFDCNGLWSVNQIWTLNSP